MPSVIKSMRSFSLFFVRDQDIVSEIGKLKLAYCPNILVGFVGTLGFKGAECRRKMVDGLLVGAWTKRMVMEVNNKDGNHANLSLPTLGKWNRQSTSAESIRIIVRTFGNEWFTKLLSKTKHPPPIKP